ncbi:MAG: hypothetical protein J6K50_04295 [Clostridia bacterium]|nr:hypothetical protein [Clostridia bacterium]
MKGKKIAVGSMIAGILACATMLTASATCVGVGTVDGDGLRLRAGAGIAYAVADEPFYFFGYRLRFFVERFRRLQEGCFIRVFRTETEGGNGGNGRKDLDRAFCEKFGVGSSEKRGQFQNDVRAREERVFGSDMFFQDRRLAALDEISAHQTHDRVRARKLARGGELVEMTVMEGVIFANYRANFHFISFHFLYNKKNLCYNIP